MGVPVSLFANPIDGFSLKLIGVGSFSPDSFAFPSLSLSTTEPLCDVSVTDAPPRLVPEAVALLLKGPVPLGNIVKLTSTTPKSPTAKVLVPVSKLVFGLIV